MFILASQSPRRKLLLSKLVNDFIVIPSNADEDSVKTNFANTAKETSRLKAYTIFKDHPNDIVLACDTVVIYKDKLLGKPKDKKEAKEMLQMLSGNRHIVLSGYTYLNGDTEINRTVKSYVYMNVLSEETIDKYIATNSPMDKAGAYGIQDDDEFHLISKIEGSYDNVMGLPTEDIKKHCF